jgi:hypothetical protein
MALGIGLAPIDVPAPPLGFVPVTPPAPFAGGVTAGVCVAIAPPAPALLEAPPVPGVLCASAPPDLVEPVHPAFEVAIAATTTHP